MQISGTSKTDILMLQITRSLVISVTNLILKQKIGLRRRYIVKNIHLNSCSQRAASRLGRFTSGKVYKLAFFYTILKLQFQNHTQISYKKQTTSTSQLPNYYSHA